MCILGYDIVLANHVFLFPPNDIVASKADVPTEFMFRYLETLDGLSTYAVSGGKVVVRVEVGSLLGDDFGGVQADIE